MKKKSQAQSQVFFYILGVVIIGLIILYGFNTIRGFGKRAEQAMVIKFKTDLDSIVDTLDYGSIKIQEFSLLGRKVCFVDLDADAQDVSQHSNICKPPEEDDADKGDYDPLICDSWATTDAVNVFLDPPPDITLVFPKLKIDSNNDAKQDAVESNCAEDRCYICMDIGESGKIKLKFEGQGDSVLVSVSKVNS